MAIGFNGLDDAVPADTAFIGDGASEIRAVKNALNTAFPAVNGAITKPTDYGSAGIEPTEADYSLLFTDMDSIINPSTSNSPVIPQGTVTMWNGDPTNSTLTTALNSKGWFLCTGGTAPNGYNIPDMQDMFVKGWGNAIVGANGGGDTRTGGAVIVGTSTAKSVNKSITIAEGNLPAHDHFSTRTENENASNPLTGSNPIRSEQQFSSGDQDYSLQGATGGAANVGKTSSYGNPSPDSLDVGLTANDFAHDHLLTDVEPSHYVIAYIIYAGVV